MLFLFLKYTYIFVISYIIGKSSLLYLEKKLSFLSPETPSASIPILVGLAIIGLLISYLSLFMRVGIAANLLLLALAFLLGFSYKKELLVPSKKLVESIPFFYKTVFFVLVFFVLFWSTQVSINMDEGAYYAGSICWAEQFPAVKGLGNLNFKLGLNSHWHLVAAVFNGSFITGFESNHINGFLYITLLLFCFEGLLFSKNNQVKILRLSILVALHYSPFWVFHIVAPSADFAVASLQWVILGLFLERIIKKQEKSFDTHHLAIFILCFFLLTIKLSAIAICFFLIPILIPLYQQKGLRPFVFFWSFGIRFCGELDYPKFNFHRLSFLSC